MAVSIHEITAIDINPEDQHWTERAGDRQELEFATSESSCKLLAKFVGFVI